MFTRTEALALLAEKFPTKDITSKDYINGGTRTYTRDPETHLKGFIDLMEPTCDGLKEGGSGVGPDVEERFRAMVETTYKNENGLW